MTLALEYTSATQNSTMQFEKCEFSSVISSRQSITKNEQISSFAWMTPMIVQDGLVSTDDEDNSKRIIKEHYRIVKSSRARTVSVSLSAVFATTEKHSRPLESFQLTRRMLENGRNANHSLIFVGDSVWKVELLSLGMGKTS